MSDVPLIHLGVNTGCMNGRNMVLPLRGQSEELRCRGKERPAFTKQAPKSLLPPSGHQIKLLKCLLFFFFFFSKMHSAELATHNWISNRPENPS